MDLRRVSASKVDERAWYCLEFYDEHTGYHGFSASFTTEADAARVIREADRIAPATTGIYYWRTDTPPIAPPPEGYRGGPLAERKP